MKYAKTFCALNALVGTANVAVAFVRPFTLSNLVIGVCCLGVAVMWYREIPS